jgi:hypothetical protein
MWKYKNLKIKKKSPHKNKTFLGGFISYFIKMLIKNKFNLILKFFILYYYLTMECCTNAIENKNSKNIPNVTNLQISREEGYRV